MKGERGGGYYRIETNGNSAIIAARILREEIIKALHASQPSSINHLTRKRALIIARYQICIRLSSAFVSSRYAPSSLFAFVAISISFDINQFGRLLCFFNAFFDLFFFFSFCRLRQEIVVNGLPFEKYFSPSLLRWLKFYVNFDSIGNKSQLITRSVSCQGVGKIWRFYI